MNKLINLKWLTRMLVPLLMVSLLSLQTFPQQKARTEDLLTACRDGQIAAKYNQDGFLWYSAGCLMGLIGILLAYVVEPVPPAVALMGKTPEYAFAYTDCYRTTAKRTRAQYAFAGLLTTGVLYLVFYIIISSENSTK